MRKALIKDLKRDFELGHLKRFKIMKSILSTKIWTVQFFDSDNNNFYLVDARNQKTREFKSLDGAVSAVEEVGFEVNILCN
jgi:hypothetical protein